MKGNLKFCDYASYPGGKESMFALYCCVTSRFHPQYLKQSLLPRSLCELEITCQFGGRGCACLSLHGCLQDELVAFMSQFLTACLLKDFSPEVRSSVASSKCFHDMVTAYHLRSEGPRRVTPRQEPTFGKLISQVTCHHLQLHECVQRSGHGLSQPI